jgi:hypothetical protein
MVHLPEFYILVMTLFSQLYNPYRQQHRNDPSEISTKILCLIRWKSKRQCFVDSNLNNFSYLILNTFNDCSKSLNASKYASFAFGNGLVLGFVLIGFFGVRVVYWLISIKESPIKNLPEEVNKFNLVLVLERV